MSTSMQVYLPVVGRVLIGLLFLISGGMIVFGGMEGINNFAGYMASIGVPASGLVVWLVLGIKVIGGLFLIAGYHARYSALALALFTFVTILLVHNSIAEMINGLKNLSIIGGLFYVMAYGAGPYTIHTLLNKKTL